MSAREARGDLRVNAVACERVSCTAARKRTRVRTRGQTEPDRPRRGDASEGGGECLVEQRQRQVIVPVVVEPRRRGRGRTEPSASFVTCVGRADWTSGSRDRGGATQDTVSS